MNNSRIQSIESTQKTALRRTVRGASTLTWMIFALVLGAIVYLLSKILPIYYSYYELENQMRAMIRVADQNTDEQIRKMLGDQMKVLKIPAEIEDVKIQRGSRTMLIELSYTEWLEVPLGSTYYELWEFDFDLRVEDDLPL